MTAHVGDWVVPSVWAMKYRLLKGYPMQFYSRKDPFFHRPWQVTPGDDMAHTVVIKKARQMGFTELFITNMFHMATLIRCRSVYTMPKWEKATEIAKTRIHFIGASNHPDTFREPVLSQLLHGWNKIMQKHVKPLNGGGESDILITGSWNEDLGESTAADRVFLDEYDRMKPGVIAAFKESLASSKINHLRIFSTPTFPKTGVDGVYRTSDQRRWMYQCPKCNHWQFMTMDNIAQRSGPASLIQRLKAHDSSIEVPDKTFEYICSKCKNKLNRWRAKTQWVAAKPGAEIHGYSASQFDCVWVSADSVMRKLRDFSYAKWNNYVAAEGFVGDSARLDKRIAYLLVRPDIVIHNRDDLDLKYRNCRVAVGVDWGDINYAFAMAISPDLPNPLTVEVWEFVGTNDVDDLIAAVVALVDRWKADVLVADYGYGQDRNPKLYRAVTCQFWACKYPPATSKNATVEPLFGPHIAQTSGTGTQKKGAYPLVEIGRAPSLQECLKDIRAKQIIIPNLRNLESVIDTVDEHFHNIALSDEILANGERVTVAYSTGPDHYLHCYNYCRIGFRWLMDHRAMALTLPALGDAPVLQEQPLISIPTGEDIADIMQLFDY